MRDAELWHFAYGSNLNIFQMIRRVGEWRIARRAYLEGYRLIFNVRSSRWGGLAANIRTTGVISDRVDGVVYLLATKKINVLSSYEGVEPTRITVKLEDGSELENVVAYLWDRPSLAGRPTEAYIRTIVEGLRHHGYGEDAVERGMAAINDTEIEGDLVSEFEEAYRRLNPDFAVSLVEDVVAAFRELASSFNEEQYSRASSSLGRLLSSMNRER